MSNAVPFQQSYCQIAFDGSTEVPVQQDSTVHRGKISEVILFALQIGKQNMHF